LRAVRSGVLELALALLAIIAAVEQLISDLFEPQTAACDVFGPRHVSPVKIAAVCWIGVKLFERSDARRARIG